MKWIKRVMWLAMVLVVGIMLAAVILPTIYKDELVEKLKITLNEQLNAEVDFEDIDISVWSTFPDIGIEIQNLTIDGVDRFEGIPFLRSKTNKIVVSLPSLIDDSVPYEIKEAHLRNALLNIVLTADGDANYLITKVDSTSSTTQYTVALNEYTVEDSEVRYTDLSSDIELHMSNVDHQGKGSFTQDEFDLDTHTTSGSVNLKSDGVSYLHEVDAELDAIIYIDVPNSKYTLKDNILRLNELNLMGNGYIQVVNDEMLIDAIIQAQEDNFRSYLSVVPHAYVDQLSNVSTSGDGSFSATIKGRYNANQPIYPALDLKLNINEGYVKYNNVANAIENINTDIQIKANEGEYKDVIVNIPSIAATVNKDQLNGKIVVSNAYTNPTIDGMLQADMDLRNWKTAIPDKIIGDMKGKISADISMAGSVDAIKGSKYDQLLFSGVAEVKDVKLSRLDAPDLSIRTARMSASPNLLDIEADDITYGSSQFSIEADIKDPMKLLITESGRVDSRVDIDAKRINIDEMMSIDTTQNITPANSHQTTDVVASLISLNIKADELIYQDEVYNEATLIADLQEDNLSINQLTVRKGKNDITLNGALNNIQSYMSGSGQLEGNLQLSSSLLDLNDFMTSTTSSEESVIAVPPNMNILLQAEVDKLLYTDMTLSNSDMKLIVKDQIASITQLNTNTLGGKIGLEGAYDSSDGTPAFNMKLDLSQIDFEKAYTQLGTMQILAPITKYLDGYFNSTLVFSGDLGSNMMPDLSTLDATGFIETFNSNIRDFPILEKLGDRLGISALQNINLDNTRNWFEVVDGTVELKPRDINVEDIKMKIGGTHTYTQDFDYVVDLMIPRARLKDNIISEGILNGLKRIENEASKIGVTLGNEDYIELLVNITGNITSPKFSIKPVGYEVTSVKEAISNIVDEKVNTAKDSIGNIIEDKKKVIRDTLVTIQEQVKDTVSTIIDEKVNTVKDSVKSVINTKIDSMKNAGVDSLKEKVKDILGKDAEKETEKIKDIIKDFNPFGKKKDKEKR